VQETNSQRTLPLSRARQRRREGHTVGVHLDLVKVVVQCRAVYQSRVS